MNACDRTAFAELLTLLAEAFNEPISDARSGAYWMALEDLPLDVVRQGIQGALRECRFFPKPADIRTLGSAVPVDAAWVNRQLSEAISGKNVGPFVGLFIQRLGGIHAVEDRLPNDRLPLVRSMYPGIVAACRARDIPIPTEAELAGSPDRLRLTDRELRLLEYEEDDDAGA